MRLTERQRHREQAGVDVLQRKSLISDDRDDFGCVRFKRTDDSVVAVFVGAQDAVRIVVSAGDQAGQVGGVGRKAASWRVGLVGYRFGS